jgi:phosphate/sulfate permease
VIVVVAVLAGAFAGAFAVVNGGHDAGNAIAAPVVTRALWPGPAAVLAAVFHSLGALLVGTAVAATSPTSYLPLHPVGGDVE